MNGEPILPVPGSLTVRIVCRRMQGCDKLPRPAEAAIGLLWINHGFEIIGLSMKALLKKDMDHL